MTPTELTLGFFFGAPIREYVLFAATLPFPAVCMAFGVPSLRGFVQLMISWSRPPGRFHGLVAPERPDLQGQDADRRRWSA